MKTADLYQTVTSQIIKQLEEGTVPWVRPWTTGNSGDIMPINGATKRPYSGINIPILWHARERHGYAENRWMTYKQALPFDAHVRKGEQGCTVVFTKRVTIKKDDEDDKKLSVMRTYHVFNVAQIDGLPAPSTKSPVSSSPAAEINQFLVATHADIRVGGDRACYVPSRDFITLPPEQAFNDREHYLATALHELAHWSGHKTRLDRQLTGRFGNGAYAAEELIAELSAAFLCAHLGIKGELRHADYIASWLKLLKEDNRAIFTAASKASAAADYLRSFSEAQQQEAA